MLDVRRAAVSVWGKEKSDWTVNEYEKVNVKLPL